MIISGYLVRKRAINNYSSLLSTSSKLDLIYRQDNAPQIDFPALGAVGEQLPSRTAA
jgi:hypothetical protein